MSYDLLYIFPSKCCTSTTIQTLDHMVIMSQDFKPGIWWGSSLCPSLAHIYTVDLIKLPYLNEYGSCGYLVFYEARTPSFLWIFCLKFQLLDWRYYLLCSDVASTISFSQSSRLTFTTLNLLSSIVMSLISSKSTMGFQFDQWHLIKHGEGGFSLIIDTWLKHGEVHRAATAGGCACS